MQLLPPPRQEPGGPEAPLISPAQLLHCVLSSSTALLTEGHGPPKHHTLNGVPEAVSISSLPTNRL